MARGNNKQAKIAVPDYPEPIGPQPPEPTPEPAPPPEPKPEATAVDPKDIKLLLTSKQAREAAEIIYEENKRLYDTNSVPKAEQNDPWTKKSTLKKEVGFGKLDQAIWKYERWGHFKDKGHKERKQAIIDAVMELPPKIRALVFVPKASIEGLFRIATHASNPDEKGVISASFTANKEYVQFAIKNLLEKANSYHGKDAQYGSAPRYYSQKDIESFEGIISFDKVHKIAREYNKLAAERRDADELTGANTEWHNLGSPRYEPTETQIMAEHLVFGIKWKSNVL